MSLVLGIDTGGTYTDGVIIERSTKALLKKAKALTTKEDLVVGIRNCINSLDFDNFQDISVLSISTTLATNAIVEGRGCEVGLILIGFDVFEGLPVTEIRTLAGGHDVKGKEKRPLDTRAVIEAVESFRGKVDAIAVSSYLSIRNPEHELKVMEMVRGRLQVPVVCAHQLARALGVKERTVTAVLNARLIPIIKELLVSVKQVMAELSIPALLMVVRGDGSLMSEEQAAKRPIETILSGPAASIIGATFLSGERDVLVLDMGGTTTDIAVLKDGAVRIDPNGAKVGGFSTMVEAAQINTYGLGGDSHIHLSGDDTALSIGPRRVYPIAQVAHRYGYYAEEMLNYALPKQMKLMFAQATDGFLLLHEPDFAALGETEQHVVNLLRNGPHTLGYLAQATHTPPYLLKLLPLVETGILGRISLTPTDIAHAAGEYAVWHTQAARHGATLLADRMGLSLGAFLKAAENLVADELCYTVLQSVSNYDGNSFDLKRCPGAQYMIDAQTGRNGGGLLRVSAGPNVPVVGIGAPVPLWLPKMREKLGGRLIIPDHTEVANAVGSATGKMMETVRILVHKDETGDKFALHAAWETKTFDTLEEATAYGLEAAKTQAMLQAGGERGDTVINLIANARHVFARASQTENDIYIETHIEAVAVERPEWERESADGNFFVDTRGRGMRVSD